MALVAFMLCSFFALLQRALDLRAYPGRFPAALVVVRSLSLAKDASLRSASFI